MVLVINHNRSYALGSPYCCPMNTVAYEDILNYVADKQNVVAVSDRHSPTCHEFGYLSEHCVVQDNSVGQYCKYPVEHIYKISHSPFVGINGNDYKRLINIVNSSDQIDIMGFHGSIDVLSTVLDLLVFNKKLVVHKYLVGDIDVSNWERSIGILGSLSIEVV